MGVALSLKCCRLWAQKFEGLNPSRSAFLYLLSAFYCFVFVLPLSFVVSALCSYFGSSKKNWSKIYSNGHVGVSHLDKKPTKLCCTLTMRNRPLARTGRRRTSLFGMLWMHNSNRNLRCSSTATKIKSGHPGLSGMGLPFKDCLVDQKGVWKSCTPIPCHRFKP